MAVTNFIRGALCVLAGLLGPVLTQAQAPASPVTVQVTFAPTSIQSGASSRLTVTLGNNNAAGVAATLTATLNDTLPAGLTLATGGLLGGSCNAAALAASAGGRGFTYAAGAAVPAGGCTIQVNVTGTSTAHNTYDVDTIPAGALQTTLGSNGTSGSATLTVHSNAIVPNVVGLSQVAAANALQAAGLTLGAVAKGAGPKTIPYNSVFAQAPAAGAKAVAGSAVAITVSTGAGLATNPNQPLTSVPNFVAPYQLSEAAAFERVCAALQSANAAALTGAQRNLLSNCNAIIGTHGGGIDAAGLKETLNTLSGKQTTAQQRTGVQFAGAQFTNVGSRLAELRQGVSGASFSGLDLGLPAGSGIAQLFAALEEASGYTPISSSEGAKGGGAGDPDTISNLTRLGFFVNGSLRRGTQDTTTYETPFDFKANSVTAGVDYRFTDKLIFGIALGHSNGSTEFTDGSGRLDSRSNSFSLYGTYYLDALYVDLIGTFGHISYAAARTTSYSINPDTFEIPTNCANSDCSVDTTGSTTARQLAFSGTVGYSFSHEGLTWGPDFTLAYTRIKANAFSENDPDQSGLALDFGEDTGESLLAKAGGHVAYAIKTPIAVILPEARAHYVHEFKNDQRALSVHFGADPDSTTPTGPVSSFVVFTDAPDRSYYDYAAGVSAQFAFGIAAFADYNAINSSDQRVHEFAFGVRIEHPL